jgi:hypothetical protein
VQFQPYDIWGKQNYGDGKKVSGAKGWRREVTRLFKAVTSLARKQ